MGHALRIRVFYHDKCFDGASSAALFSRFYRERIRSDAEFEFTGLVHRAGALFDEKQFDGDENAIVDFKYSSSPQITWWFDHHQSAFLTESDAEHFEQDQSNRKFYDPDFKSCTSFIAMIAQERFGRNATAQETGAAVSRIFLDDSGFQTQLTGANGCDVSAWTASDNGNVKRRLFFHLTLCRGDL